MTWCQSTVPGAGLCRQSSAAPRPPRLVSTSATAVLRWSRCFVCEVGRVRCSMAAVVPRSKSAAKQPKLSKSSSESSCKKSKRQMASGTMQHSLSNSSREQLAATGSHVSARPPLACAAPLACCAQLAWRQAPIRAAAPESYMSLTFMHSMYSFWCICHPSEPWHALLSTPPPPLPTHSCSRGRAWRRRCCARCPQTGSTTSSRLSPTWGRHWATCWAKPARRARG